jgi:hypothetical protein
MFDDFLDALTRKLNQQQRYQNNQRNYHRNNFDLNMKINQMR